jgi:immune inhibitor A
LLLSLAAPVAAVGPKETGHDTDNISSPLSERQAALKQAAQEAVLQGKAEPEGDNKVVKVAPGQYVELAFEGSDNILTLLAEFGEGDDPTHGGTRGHANLHDPDGNAADGPLHNEIEEPDRSVDNTTIWEEDFSKDYYDALLYDRGLDPSMANMYLELSSGRYTVDGMVGDWVKVPFNAANYGSNYCGSIVCQDTWFFVQDQANTWYDSLITDGMTAAEIDEMLAEYDVWDRYDYNGNGNFDEPDGYIDHFQSVHAGEGEETGGGAQGTDAIWSHRWYVQLTQIGAGGPTVGGTVVPFGGTQIGDSKYWIGDYTIEPENGGVGVFAHEYAHDLGLPDLYDTSGNTGGAENSTAFWTLMSSGSYGSTGIPADGIGSRPTHMGAWEKFYLGWLDYTVARPGKTTSIRLGPASTTTRQAQAAFVVLPDREVESTIGDPYEGENFYYSGAGNDLDNFMTKAVTLGAGAHLTAKVRYDIEVDWDYAYVVVSTDGGATWTGVETNLSTDTSPNGQNFGNGITGSSGGDWVDLDADLSPYTGDVLLGFRYWTDVSAVESGFMIDNISIDGGPVDGAETDAGWTFDPADGFSATTGQETLFFFNAYVLENRQYLGYDDSLRTGPYNFGFLNTMPNWVEHFNYEDGLLISYWNEEFGADQNNNVGDHPGAGFLLPVDAHPDLEHWDGTNELMRPRILSRDSTFGLSGVPALTLHNNGLPTHLPAKPAVSVFDDSREYWFNSDTHGTTPNHPGRYQPGWASVDVPNTGTRVTVKSVSRTGFMQIEVRAPGL